MNFRRVSGIEILNTFAGKKLVRVFESFLSRPNGDEGPRHVSEGEKWSEWKSISVVNIPDTFDKSDNHNFRIHFQWSSANG